MAGYFLMDEGAAPSTPSAGEVSMFAKTDGRVYGKDDTGTEFSLSGYVSGTAQATTSGTSIDFTGIPSGVKRIVFMFANLSTNGTSDIILQIGDSGGVETTGYSSGAGYVGSTTGAGNSTAGFMVSPTPAAASVIQGTVMLSLLDSSTNTWVASVCGGYSSNAFSIVGGGSKSLSATLDRLRLTTAGGTNTFDLGSANILYS